MPQRGKRYRDAAKGYDRLTPYPAAQALELVKTFATAKFDETIEAAYKLGIDPRKADQAVRGTISLPHGTGQDVRVAVFAPADKISEALAAGAKGRYLRQLSVSSTMGPGVKVDIGRVDELVARAS
jgi:large subunit ribosomal protein L1